MDDIAVNVVHSSTVGGNQEECWRRCLSGFKKKREFSLLFFLISFYFRLTTAGGLSLGNKRLLARRRLFPFSFLGQSSTTGRLLSCSATSGSIATPERIPPSIPPPPEGGLGRRNGNLLRVYMYTQVRDSRCRKHECLLAHSTQYNGE